MLYQNVKEYLAINFVLKLYGFLVKHNVCPETSRDELLKVVCFMQEKGWVYWEMEEGNLVAVAGAYLITSEDKEDQIPESEEGEILYVPFAASSATDKTILKKMLSKCLKKYPQAKEVLFYERGDDSKRKKFTIKGETNEKENTEPTSNS